MDEAEDSLAKNFKPVVLDVLYRFTKQTGDVWHDETVVLRYLRSVGILNLDQLAMMDTHHLIWNEFLANNLHHRKAALSLGTVCEYIAEFGSEAFLEVYRNSTRQNMPTDDILKDLRKALSQPNSDKNQHKQIETVDLTPSDRRHVSLEDARTRLERIFQHPSYWSLMLDSAARQEWLDKGVLKLLDLYPTLAWERFVNLAERHAGPCTPFVYSLFAGCDISVLKQMVGHNQWVLREGKDWVDQFLVHASLEPYVPVAIFERMLELMPHLGRNRDRTNQLLFLEILFSLGFNAGVLEHVRTYLEDTVDEFYLKKNSILGVRTTPSALDANRADVLLSIVPQLKLLEYGFDMWTLDGWARLLQSLPGCPHPKLVSLKLSLPVQIVHTEEVAKGALRSFIDRMQGPNLQEIVLVGHVPLTPRPALLEAFASCLHEISAALTSRRASSRLPQLTLSRMAISDRGTGALLANDVFDSIDIQADGLRYSCPWELKGNTGVQEGVKVLKLGLHGLVGTNEGWNMIWEKMSKLSRLRKLMYSPGPLYDFGELKMPLDSIAYISKLQTLCLFAHTSETTFDITESLAALLDHGTLEFLQVEGSHEDDEGNIGCLAYSIEVDALCRKLRDNKSLQFLFLRGVELEGTNVSRSFLNVLKEHNNTNLEFMDICDDRHFYTIIPKDSWRRDVHHGFTYECYPDAWQIYYLTCFNRFGRGKVQDKSTTADEFVQLLDQVHSGVDVEADEEEFHRSILALCLWNNPVAQLNEIYARLIVSPKRWCNAVKRNVEALSIKYGLLRESPGLWCANVLQPEPPLGRKRRRLA